MISLILKIIAFSLLIVWQVYWWFTEKTADREKQKVVPSNFLTKIRVQSYFVFDILMFFQVLGWIIMPIHSSFMFQILGMIITVLGFGIGVAARRTLGNNWTHADEYQIKRNHDLVVSGIYSKIRHPIYTGLILFLFGIEMVLQSYLFVILFVIFSIWFYVQGKKEETLLKKHFGKKYEEYMKKTKMFIPYIF